MPDLTNLIGLVPKRNERSQSPLLAEMGQQQNERVQLYMEAMRVDNAVRVRMLPESDSVPYTYFT